MNTAACRKWTTDSVVNDDRAHIAAVLRGDTAAYGTLVNKHWERIYQRMLQRLGNPEDAEEVTQDAFRRAYENLGKFRWEASFTTWLFQIASNLAHNRYWYWKRRGRDRSISLSAPVDDEPGGREFVETLADAAKSPAEALRWQELQGSIERALPQLGSDYHHILELRLERGLSYDAISAKLKLPLGTVKSRIARARQQLLKILEIDSGGVRALTRRFGTEY